MLRTTLLILFSLILFNLCATLLWENPAPVRQGENVQWNRAGTETADGCLIYVWSDTRNGDRDVYAQKVSSLGTDMWDQPLLVVGKPGRQSDPVIIKTVNNDFVIAWIDFSIDKDGDVYAQKINANGQKLWAAEGIVVCNAPGIQTKLNIEHQIFGGVYIVWEDFRNSSCDLYGQVISSEGIVHWSEQGIALASAIGDEHLHTIWSDGYASLVIGYVHSIEGHSYVFTKGIWYDGIVGWSTMLNQSNDLSNCTNIKMAPIDNSSFVFTWQQNGTPTGIFAQRVSASGEIMWAAPVTVYSDSLNIDIFQQNNPRIIQTSDNGVIITWEDSRNIPIECDIYAQKLNLAGERLWNTQGIVVTDAPSNQTEIRLAADNAGGCIAVWEDSRTDENFDIYAQHLSATGAAIWTPNGNAICATAGEQSGAHIRIINSYAYIVWWDYRASSSGLFYQVLNPVGTAQLSANGNEIHTGVDGSVVQDSYQVLALTDGTAAVWIEDRNPGGFQIFYQITNSDGSPRLEPNGRFLSTTSLSPQDNFNAIVTPENNIVITWVENERVRVQMLDSEGFKLWGDNGIAVSDMFTYSQRNPRVSYDDGAIYVGWSNLNQYNTAEGMVQLYRVYAQKLMNGTRMWGDGIMVSQAPTSNNYFECLLDSVTGRYFTWRTFYINPDYYQSINVKKINSDGSTSEGWAPLGTAVSDYVSMDQTQQNSRSVLTTAGLYVAWEDTRVDYLKSIYSQLISPEGNRLWASEGVALGNTVNEQSIGTVAGGNDITICWSENIEPYNFRVKVQRYSFTGLPLWGENGHFVAPGGINIAQTNPVHCFGNGGYVVSWDQQYNSATANRWDGDIYYQYLESNGSPALPAPNLLLTSPDNQYKPHLAAYGNIAYIYWMDSDLYDDWNRCGEEEYEFYGLYAQKLSMGGSEANEDEIVPVANLVLEQNYPNPFNPSTNISFSLKNSSDIELSIYNLKGQVVRTLSKGKLDKGRYTLSWDGKDDNDKPVSSGVFFYRLSEGKKQLTHKMVMLK